MLDAELTEPRRHREWPWAPAWEGWHDQLDDEGMQSAAYPYAETSRTTAHPAPERIGNLARPRK